MAVVRVGGFLLLLAFLLLLLLRACVSAREGVVELHGRNVGREGGDVLVVERANIEVEVVQVQLLGHG